MKQGASQIKSRHEKQKRRCLNVASDGAGSYVVEDCLLGIYLFHLVLMCR